MKLDRSRPLLYLVTKGDATDENVNETGAHICKIVRRAAADGITFVQIREKQLSARNLYALAAAAVAVTHGTSTRLLINDRADVALAARADGVHLTATSIPVEALRGKLPTDFLIGVSTHSRTEIESARSAGADFAIYGPVFATPGKGDPKGTDDLREICISVDDFPVFGVGGIDAGNIKEVWNAGAAGAAAIRWLHERYDC